MERIQASDKTESLVRAMEIADECDFMLVLYQGKEGSSLDSGFISVGSPKLMELLWFIERFKLWLLGPLRKEFNQ